MTLHVTSSGVTAGVDGAVNVTNVALTLSGEVSTNEGSLYTLLLSATGDDTLISWTIDWGDGRPAQIVAGAATSVTHVFADGPQTCTIGATATEEDGTYVATTVAVTVVNVAPVVTIEGLPGFGPEGSAVTLTAKVTDPGVGETLTYVWTVTKNGVAYGSGGTGASFVFTPDDNATYEVRLTVTDDSGEAGRAAETMIVFNVAPTLAVNGPALGFVGTPYTLSLCATDPGADTVSHWIIAWGDGTTETIGGNAASVVHSYTNANYYVINAFAETEDGTFQAEQMHTTISTTRSEFPDWGVVTSGGLPQFTPEGTSVTLTAVVVYDPYEYPPGETPTYVYQWQVKKDVWPDTTGGDQKDYVFTPDDSCRYEISLYVYRGDGTPVGSTWTWIMGTDVPPTLTPVGAPTGTAGMPYTLSLFATDPGDDVIRTWTINWAMARSMRLRVPRAEVTIR